MTSGGVHTFLFTDVEGSTRLWESDQDRMAAALEVHDRILNEAISLNNGRVFSTAGDAFAAAFDAPSAALAAAEQAQVRLGALADHETLAVRMGIHTGEAQERNADFFGPTLNRTARIMSSGHGGQILVSSTAASMLDDPRLRSLGTHQLKDLSSPEEIFQLGTVSFPPLETLDADHHNLPVQLTALIGRDELVEATSDLVAAERLVTLLGIGGSGKTRLAHNIGADLVGRFPDGVWFVDLVPVEDEDRVVETIGAATGLRLDGDGATIDRLCAALTDRRTLLILDNCEHVIDGAADAAEAILRATAGVHILATSREPLDIPEEHRRHVEPLDLEAEVPAAYELFEAAASRVGAAISSTDMDEAVAVCRHLDGLPLALELAGAQLRHLSVAQLRARLDDRFGLLERGRRGRGHRQASLLRVLEDTVEMLTEDEWTALLHLAAFPGSFDRDAAEAVMQDAVVGSSSRAFAGLVDRNLLTPAGPTTFRLLETVKLYARQRWPDAPETSGQHPRDRHAAWFLATLRRHPDEARYVSIVLAEWLTEHYDDLQTVERRLLDIGATGDLVDVYSSASLAMMWPFGNSRILATGARIEQALATHDLSDHERGVLHGVLVCGSLGGRRIDWLLKSSGPTADLTDPGIDPVAHAYGVLLASWGLSLRDTETALATSTRAADLAREHGALRVAALCEIYCVTHLLVGGDLDAARQRIDAVERMLEESSDGYDQAWGAFWAGCAALFAVDDPQRAIDLHERLRPQGGLGDGSELLLSIARASLEQVDECVANLERASTEYRLTGDDGLPDVLLPAVTLAMRRDRPELARRWLAAIRHADKPTQNFLSTAIYRQLRTAVGIADEPPAETTEDVWDEAREWLLAQAPEQ